MIDRTGGEITFHCDLCADFIETEHADWNDAMASFKAAGWKSVKVGKTWEHRCPSCAEDGK